MEDNSRHPKGVEKINRRKRTVGVTIFVGCHIIMCYCRLTSSSKTFTTLLVSLILKSSSKICSLISKLKTPTGHSDCQPRYYDIIFTSNFLSKSKRRKRCTYIRWGTQRWQRRRCKYWSTFMPFSGFQRLELITSTLMKGNLLFSRIEHHKEDSDASMVEAHQGKDTLGNYRIEVSCRKGLLCSWLNDIQTYLCL